MYLVLHMPALLFALWSLTSPAFTFCYATTLNSWRGGQSNLLYLLPLRKAFQPLFTQKQFPFQSQLYILEQKWPQLSAVWALTTATTGLELSHLPRKYFFFFGSGICFFNWFTFSARICSVIDLNNGGTCWQWEISCFPSPCTAVGYMTNTQPATNATRRRKDLYLTKELLTTNSHCDGDWLNKWHLALFV